ncbi:D-alanyl-D-alanine serine-type carboxypeptidase [Neokomagataea thailandica NBRC 106555]|uniref:D-alanyl-D-alanine carboxypeptidase n=2 Tax=Neokomagataea TaxID=1223423 RepID=A0A4Y6V6Y5_9PROT|nr:MULTISPECIES: D-alanyl-D-alanine carboxypeptidase family protein [Neokomagataea]QDH24247.1 D-alanyl-D-alanine carboxypeptidase [Neokomagataea tanensis]GBR52931.1 D-alanyl-D-alanine serine-type carboxypeptidase [Neokomagataea thailandica NBRC 106555]
MRFSSRLAFILSALVLVIGIGCFPAGKAWAQYPGHISSYVIDAQTGEVLSQSDAELQRYPASLTKLMTLYLAFRALQAHQITLDEQIPVSIHASIQKPSKLGLVPGTRFTVEQAILALVTKSANDAACALGEFLGGGDEVRFAQLMTQQARALGMANTTFRNASGLPDPDQVTTAHDLGILAQRLISDFPGDYHYFDVPQFYFHRRVIPNHDPMLKIYSGADGLKTGYTDLAGHNLVTSAIRGNTRLIGVVMGASSNASRSMAMAALLDRGFADKGLAPQPLMHQSTLMASARSGGRSSGRHGAGRRPVEVADASGHRRMAHHIGSVRMVSLHAQGAVHHTKHRVRG